MAVCTNLEQLMTKFDVMATRIWIGRCLDELYDGTVHPPIEIVIQQDHVRAKTKMGKWVRPSDLSRRE